MHAKAGPILSIHSEDIEWKRNSDLLIKDHNSKFYHLVLTILVVTETSNYINTERPGEFYFILSKPYICANYYVQDSKALSKKLVILEMITFTELKMQKKINNTVFSTSQLISAFVIDTQTIHFL